MTAGMHLPEVVSPEEWLAARRELLAKEKELTRLRAGPRHRRADRPGRRLEPGRQCLASPATLGPAIRPRHYGEVCLVGRASGCYQHRRGHSFIRHLNCIAFQSQIQPI